MLGENIFHTKLPNPASSWSHVVQNKVIIHENRAEYEKMLYASRCARTAFTSGSYAVAAEGRVGEDRELSIEEVMARVGVDRELDRSGIVNVCGRGHSRRNKTLSMSTWSNASRGPLKSKFAIPYGVS